jgi:hypothetical protein
MPHTHRGGSEREENGRKRDWTKEEKEEEVI